MKSGNATISSENGIEVYVYEWLPEDSSKIKGVVQISHGLAEHAERYERFANVMVNEGFAVYANDHRGHGKTAGSLENTGFFAMDNGWNMVVEDMHKLTDYIKKTHTGKPFFLFGHSMGSLLSRGYVLKYPDELDGLLLSGTAGDPGLLGKIGMFVAKREMKKVGKTTKSPFLDNLSFGKFNKAFKPNRTDFDWLSRDNDEVDKYINDPYCGFVCASSLYHDLLVGIKTINDSSNINKMPKDLPIYLYSGGKDPVGNNSKGVLEVYKKYKKAGIEDVSYKIYKDARHETLNEINRDEVHKDVINWLNSHLK